MSLRTLLLAATCASLPLHAGDDYVLTTDTLVELGNTYQTCVTAPAGDMVFLVVSATEGPTPTPYGMLDIGLPPIVIFTFPMPSISPVCFDHVVHCEPEIVGLTGYFQFLSLNMSTGQAGISNQTSVTVIDDECTEAGDFVTFTQGGWGSSCNGNNPGCFRDAHFDSVYPNGLVIGDPDGIDGDAHRALVLTSSAAVEALLPEGGPAKALSGDELDPLSSSAGVLAGQIVAARLNVDYDDAGMSDPLKAKDTIHCGDLAYVAGVHASLIGMRVRDVLAIAESVFSGAEGPMVDVDEDGTPEVSIGDLNTALDVLNNNFVDGNTDNGNFTVP